LEEEEEEAVLQLQQEEAFALEMLLLLLPIRTRTRTVVQVAMPTKRRLDSVSVLRLLPLDFQRLEVHQHPLEVTVPRRHSQHQQVRVVDSISLRKAAAEAAVPVQGQLDSRSVQQLTVL
jgi:hypothetical protein